MKNWNTDVSKFNDETEKRIWEIRQMIMYGSDGEKISLEELKRYWPRIRDTIDPEKRRQFELFLWNKKYSLPESKRFF